MVVSGNNSALSGVVTLNAGGGIVAASGNALGTGSATAAGNTSLFATNYLGGALVTQTVPNDITLNANLDLRGNDNLILSGVITNSAANRTITSTMQPAATATLSGTINLSNDATSRTLTITNSTYGGGVVSGVTGGDVTVSALIQNGGGSPASALIKGGVGLVVLTNNANSFTGATTVAGGNLRITSNGALGGRISEQQTFGVTNGAGPNGSFTITYNGQTTTALNYGVTTPPTALDVQNALNALPSIARTGGLVTVTSSNPAGPATVYTVTFGGNLAGVDVTQIASINFTAPAAASGAITTTVAGGGGTVVNNGATLQVVPGLNVLEPLTLNNNGLGNFGALRFVDVTPGITETTTWAGSINFNANPTWAGVDGGGASPDRLVLTGANVSGGGALVVKTGAGEMEWGGNTDNSQVVFNAVSPMDDGLEIRQGSVLFNKPQVAGVDFAAIIGGGRVTVGDGGGGANADRLVLIGTSLDQIGGAVPMTVAASGLFSLAGSLTEQIPGAITLQRLMSVAGGIDSSATRTLILGGNIDVANAGMTTGATPAATISGNLNAGGARTITTNDSYVLNAAEDLIISAIISNATPTFAGAGTAALTGVNTYAGTTAVNSATLDFNGSFNNGLNAVVNGVLVVRGAGTLGTGAVSVTSGASLVLDNSGTDVNRIADGVTVTVANGRLRLIGNAAGSNEVFNLLTINAGGDVGRNSQIEVDSTAGGVTVLAPNSLTRGAGAVANFTPELGLI
jgi:fibronectin-binding autotransporter adhesin